MEMRTAFCFLPAQCINMFNLVYLFMRYHELLPVEAQRLRDNIENVMPDVKNLDKYMTRRDGNIFVGAFAAISIAFDFVLYVGVDSVYGKSIQRLGTEPTYQSQLTAVTTAPTEADSRDNHTESVRIPREQVVDYQSTIVDHDAHRLTEEQTSVLLLYVIFRLIFKVVALAGIKDYASRVAVEREKRELALQLGYEADTVSLEEPFVPGPPKSKRGSTSGVWKPTPTPPAAGPAGGPPGAPAGPARSPGIVLPPGLEPPPPPGFRFLFPPPAVLPYPKTDTMPQRRD
ncbi:hypothetical protein V5799_033398 [Amblyomma americanum]|uniref:Uncharacterized protein n=1 Tax=Amblyomma americanum TaxID=6943 RepID=A0AAQ4DNF5_AMBAM